MRLGLAGLVSISIHQLVPQFVGYIWVCLEIGYPHWCLINFQMNIAQRASPIFKHTYCGIVVRNVSHHTFWAPTSICPSCSDVHTPGVFELGKGNARVTAWQPPWKNKKGLVIWVSYSREDQGKHHGIIITNGFWTNYLATPWDGIIYIYGVILISYIHW